MHHKSNPMNYSISFWSRVTGISLLLMAVVAGLSIGGILVPLQQLSAEELPKALVEQKSSYALLLDALVVVLLLDAVVAYAVYTAFKTLNRTVAQAAAWLRAGYTVVLGVALSFLFLNTSPGLNGEEVLANLEAFQGIWSAGLVLFGAHVWLLGVLLRDAGAGRWLVVLVHGAGASYVLVHLLKLLLPTADWVDLLEMTLAAPMALGELAFAVWMLAKPGRGK